ncbi:MAG: amidohydrolase [Pseudomarimonas sp.]
MSPNRDLRVSLIQAATLWHDPAGNRALYADMARPLTGQTDLIVLPETFTSGFSNEALSSAEGMDGPTVAWMQRLAAELNAVITGSIQCRVGELVFNRLIWARPDGSVAHYDKRHLFRMANEHQRYAAGQASLTVELHGWRIRPLVCYDLRFPVFIRNVFDQTAQRFEYDLLLFVANWPAARRHAWRSLLPARAIENLSYCVGVNRVGVDGNSIAYAGDSVALDMLGLPMVECGAQAQVVTVALGAAALGEHRQRFPAQLDSDRFELLG